MCHRGSLKHDTRKITWTDFLRKLQIFLLVSLCSPVASLWTCQLHENREQSRSSLGIFWTTTSTRKTFKLICAPSIVGLCVTKGTGKQKRLSRRIIYLTINTIFLSFIVFAGSVLQPSHIAQNKLQEETISLCHTKYRFTNFSKRWFASLHNYFSPSHLAAPQRNLEARAWKFVLLR